jgi:hypothetical protein
MKIGYTEIPKFFGQFSLNEMVALVEKSRQEVEKAAERAKARVSRDTDPLPVKTVALISIHHDGSMGAYIDACEWLQGLLTDGVNPKLPDYDPQVKDFIFTVMV